MRGAAISPNSLRPSGRERDVRRQDSDPSARLRPGRRRGDFRGEIAVGPVDALAEREAIEARDLDRRAGVFSVAASALATVVSGSCTKACGSSTTSS